MSHSAVEIQQLSAREAARPSAFTLSPQGLPTWLAEVNPERPIRKILVATDFSETATRAVEFAMPLARQCDATITLLHVIDISAQTVEGRSIPAAELMSCLWTTAFESMGRLACALSRQVISQTAVEEGLPCEIIVERSRNYDLLVVGHPSRRAPWNLFSHHTVQHVLQNAACPVIVAPAPRNTENSHSRLW